MPSTYFGSRAFQQGITPPLCWPCNHFFANSRPLLSCSTSQLHNTASKFSPSCQHSYANTLNGSPPLQQPIVDCWSSNSASHNSPTSTQSLSSAKLLHDDWKHWTAATAALSTTQTATQSLPHLGAASVITQRPPTIIQGLLTHLALNPVPYTRTNQQSS